jgi:hypothetical protein
LNSSPTWIKQHLRIKRFASFAALKAQPRLLFQEGKSVSTFRRLSTTISAHTNLRREGGARSKFVLAMGCACYCLVLEFALAIANRTGHAVLVEQTVRNV